MSGFYNDILLKLGLSPEESVGSKVTIIGFCGVFIEGHSGIKEYSEELIKVGIKRKTVLIKGKNMVVCIINKDEIYIKGKIFSVGEEVREE